MHRRQCPSLGRSLASLTPDGELGSRTRFRLLWELPPRVVPKASNFDSTFWRPFAPCFAIQPHLLSNQQITEKSAALDQLWTRAKADPSLYIPALREELGDFKNPIFFLYDGSTLLLSLSDTPADRKIALAAMARCDLRDVQAKDYFLQVHRMASLSEDTTAAAFHILEQPKFTVFIPQHVLTLGQNYALIYLLLPTDMDYWLRPAIKSPEDRE
jgi:hypothetical protein